MKCDQRPLTVPVAVSAERHQIIWRKTEGPKDWNVVFYPEDLCRTSFWFFCLSKHKDKATLLRHAAPHQGLASSQCMGTEQGGGQGPFVFPRSDRLAASPVPVRLESSRAASRAGRAGSGAAVTCCRDLETCSASEPRDAHRLCRTSCWAKCLR